MKTLSVLAPAPKLMPDKTDEAGRTGYAALCVFSLLEEEEPAS